MSRTFQLFGQRLRHYCFIAIALISIDCSRAECQLSISSQDGKRSGNVTSPGYPGTYPEDIKCRYTFLSAGKERVRIIFYEFSLYLPPIDREPYYNGTLKRCDERNDHMTGHVLIGSRMSKIDDFCGQETPPQLMSTQNFLTLEFVAKSSVHKRLREGSPYRFLLHYEFVNDLGLKDMRARKDPSKVCVFHFHSTDASNGTLWSPNYPGYYPRDTDCHFIFHGRPNEVARILFTYFDVEGYSQCHDETQSDYVIFSNYQTHDRTNRRYCGITTPLGYPIVSESNYFRMVFKANEIFDATGFFAHYQFVKPETAQLKRLKSSDAVEISGLASLVITIFLLLIVI